MKKMPPTFAPPCSTRSGRPPRPDMEEARANPGRWFEMPYDIDEIKGLRAVLSYARNAKGENWELRQSKVQGKAWLKYEEA